MPTPHSGAVRNSSPAARLFKFLNSKNDKAVSSGRRVALTLDALNQHMTGKTRRLDIVHACNPPDILLPAVRFLRKRGAAFVFDLCAASCPRDDADGMDHRTPRGRV